MDITVIGVYMIKINFKKAKYFILLLVLLFCAYPFIEPYWVQTKEMNYSSDNIPQEFNGFKVVFISDIHHGKTYSIKRVEKLVDKVNKMRPDIILLGGDYVSGDSKYIKPCFDELKKLKAVYGVYGVMGNHDHYQGSSLTSQSMKNAGIIQLDNQAIWISKGNDKIKIGGVGDLWEDKQDLEPTLKDIESSNFVMLMSHNPDFVEEINTDKIDLMLSGHTHGGQLTLFGLWAPLVPSRYGEKYRTGLVETKNTKVLISNGIGNAQDYPVRFFARPQINVIYLQNPNN
jgi:predicted MPP superfamily phosphohydrolase